MRKVLFSMLFACIVILFSSCAGKNKAIIKGEFCGMKDKLIVLEEVVPGRTIFIDSTRTDRRGRYSFRYEFADETPVFLIVRHDKDYLTLLASPGENIKISSVVNLHRNYEVSGSEGSSQIRDLSLSAAASENKMDSLFRKYNETDAWELKKEIELQASAIYRAQKVHHIDFLVKNPKSMAIIYALFQRLPGGGYIFTDKDFLYFASAADSLSPKYPNSAHVKNLVKSVSERSQMVERLRSLSSVARSIPEINLPDMHGNIKSLTSLKGKVVLLSFWSANSTGSQMLNAELKQLYNKYKDQGFEIFQVSLDGDQSSWINSVIAQNIPWISVRDEQGSKSVAARTYNIQSIPANYLINRDGDIDGKNLWGKELEDNVANML